MISRPARMALLAALPGLLLGCGSVYYATLERFGIEKRDLLRERVEEARSEQEVAKEEFQSALERFQALTGFQGGDLEAEYDRLSAAYAGSETAAEDVRARIEAVERVAADLFREWAHEIREIQDPSLRSRSEALRRETDQRYQVLLAAMKRAEASMAPVLAAFRDQVLFLKHNLNARAIASLDGERIDIERDVATLVHDMEDAIAEADAFLATLDGARG